MSWSSGEDILPTTFQYNLTNVNQISNSNSTEESEDEIINLINYRNKKYIENQNTLCDVCSESEDFLGFSLI